MSNKIHVIGNLTADPDMSYGDSGVAYTTFGVADNYRVKGKDGTWGKATIFHNMIAFKGLAETCNNYLHKGSKVSIWGRLTERKYVDKHTGEQKLYREIRVEEMEMLSPKKAESSSSDDGEFDSETPF